MKKHIRALLEKKEGLLAQARSLLDSVAEEGCDLNDDEQKQYDAYIADIEKLSVKIDREKALEEAERTMQGYEVHDDSDISGGTLQDDPKCGFKDIGEFVLAVHRATANHVIDERLTIGAAAPATFSSEGVGADGGFLIPPEFSTQIFSLSLEGDALLPLTDNNNISGNSMAFPRDETTPWGTNGIRCFWESEAAAATLTKPIFKTEMLRLHKLMALVPVTDEMLSDGPAIASYITRKMAESIRWKTNDAIVNGTGAGQPEGVFNGAALVTQAKEAGQTADTIDVNNVSKMFGRMPASSIGRAVWLIHNDAFNQLIVMTVGNAPIWTPPSTGVQGSPAGSLLGRPIIMSQSAQTLGDKGDIQFHDFSTYTTITKRGGIETASSMHLYFDAAVAAFRAVFRVDGQPAVRSVITPANGATTLSPYVTLAIRA